MQAPNKQKALPFNAMTTEKILRVALYIRVSTEEQVLHGYSLEAQEEELVRFAAEHHMKVVGIFRDEGNSARKPALKRKVMQELLFCRGYDLEITGAFDEATAITVMQFQKDMNLKRDGKCGPDTWSALLCVTGVG